MKAESWGRSCDLMESSEGPCADGGTMEHLPNLGGARHAQLLACRTAQQSGELPHHLDPGGTGREYPVAGK